MEGSHGFGVRALVRTGSGANRFFVGAKTRKPASVAGLSELGCEPCVRTANPVFWGDGSEMPRSRPPHGILARKDPSNFLTGSDVGITPTPLARS